LTGFELVLRRSIIPAPAVNLAAGYSRRRTNEQAH
jgi:hypothetical protein